MKKGFTLIELLAVIVILAIIALIATPIVLSIINQSKENAQLRSAEMYLDAVEQAVALEKMNNTSFNPNTCTITKEGNLDCDTKDGILEVKVNGEKPESGSITFEKGKIKDVSLEYSNGKIIVKNEKGNLEYGNYISLGNYQHKTSSGKIEKHKVTFEKNGHGTCSKCKDEVLAAGAYDDNGVMLASWDELTKNYGLDIMQDLNGPSVMVDPNNPSTWYYITNNNEKLKSATQLVIGEEVTKIGNYTFFMTVLKNVYIPNGVTSIGNYAFCCTEISSVKLPDSVTSIGNLAFQGCIGLTTIEIPDSVTSIGNSSFDSCKNLTSITLGNNLTSIGSSAFSGCTGLKIIEIPDSVTSIGSMAFSDCKNLTHVSIENGSIGSYAFQRTGLISLEFGSGITTVGEYAFRDISTLKNITIDSGTFNLNTFNGSSNVSTLKIGMSNIGKYTFNSLASVDTLELKESVTTIEPGALTPLKNLERIIVSENNKNYKVEDNSLIEIATNTLLRSSKNITTIPSSVTSIGYYALSGNTGLKTIEIPNNIIKIDTGAFSGCTGLTSITISNSVKNIESFAFSTNTSLTSIEIPEGITTLANDTFIGCSNLTSIILPKSLKSLGNGVFSSTGITTINYRGTEEEWNTNIGSIGSNHFYGPVPTNLKIVYNYNG